MVKMLVKKILVMSVIASVLIVAKSFSMEEKIKFKKRLKRSLSMSHKTKAHKQLVHKDATEKEGQSTEEKVNELKANVRELFMLSNQNRQLFLNVKKREKEICIENDLMRQVIVKLTKKLNAYIEKSKKQENRINQLEIINCKLLTGIYFQENEKEDIKDVFEHDENFDEIKDLKKRLAEVSLPDVGNVEQLEENDEEKDRTYSLGTPTDSLKIPYVPSIKEAPESYDDKVNILQNMLASLTINSKQN